MQLTAPTPARLLSRLAVPRGALALAGLLLVGCQDTATTRAPETRVDNYRETLHGEEIIDPYRWLEDQQSPETRAWIDAQNEYSHSLLDPLSVRDPIAYRLAKLTPATDVSLLKIRGDRYFVSKREGDAELPAIYARQGIDGEDQLLLDPNEWSEDKRTSGGLMDISRDGTLMAYWVRIGGEDESEIRFRSLSSGEDLPVKIPRHLNRGFALQGDGSACYYTNHDRQKGPRVHRLDLRTGADEVIFGDGYAPDVFLNPALANNDRLLLISAAHGWTRNDLFLLDIAVKKTTPLVEGIDAHFTALPAGDRLIVQTDWQAPRGRILTASWNNPQQAAWEEIIPQTDDAINAVTFAGGKLFVKYLHNVSARISSFTVAGRSLGDLDLPGIGNASLEGDWSEPNAALTYTSFMQPTTTYIIAAETAEKTVFSQPETPIRPDDFETQQVWVTSKDGARVPMFLVHHKGVVPNGTLPTLLHGYGGFNVSRLPSFNPAYALWVEQGGVFALANIRGGSEFGDEWHRAGMLENKQNVFDDFISAAEWLVEHKYTNPERLAIQGVSNGGLLMGATLTQRPDLFRAVLCEYPDLDMVGYHRFPNNNKPALQEYGDASKPEHFAFLRKYSPYQAVKPETPYPAVLFTTGDADTRAPPLQARKMTARLQAATTSGRPVMLLYDTQAGHAGGRPQSKIIEDASFEYAFLFWQLGINWTEPN